MKKNSQVQLHTTKNCSNENGLIHLHMHTVQDEYVWGAQNKKHGT